MASRNSSVDNSLLFNFSVITPLGIFTNERVSEVTIPTVTGQIEILKDHAQYIGVLGTGILSYINETGTVIHLVVHEGTVEVRSNGSVLILSDEVEVPAGDIGFVRGRIDELRRSKQVADEGDLQSKAFRLVEAYTELEQKISKGTTKGH
jgi:F-type H+-transporting ATPase subunit epsilon